MLSDDPQLSANPKSATRESLDRDHGSIRFDRTQASPAEPTFRAPPHNIEAEQALLGAILVNNEAFYRVSDFLEPKHFFEPIHQRIFELAGSLVRANKLATPVTLKTFLPADFDIAGLSAQSISGAACRRGDDDHQCRGLRPHRLRSFDPPRSDHDRRGYGQPRL